MASTLLRNAPSTNPNRRSPGGVGLNSHAYDTQGRIFPNAQAARLGEQGQLQIGVAGETSVQDTLNHPTLKTLAMASILDCMPGFQEHWATPFLSVDPVASYADTGDLFEKFPTSDRVQTDLFRLKTIVQIVLKDDNPLRKTLDSWLD